MKQGRGEDERRDKICAGSNTLHAQTEMKNYPELGMNSGRKDMACIGSFYRLFVKK
jgi:hypothetical protein